MPYAYTAVAVMLCIMGKDVYECILVRPFKAAFVFRPCKAPPFTVISIVILIVRVYQPFMKLDVNGFFIPNKLVVAFKYFSESETLHCHAYFFILKGFYKYIRVTHRSHFGFRIKALHNRTLKRHIFYTAFLKRSV